MMSAQSGCLSTVTMKLCMLRRNTLSVRVQKFLSYYKPYLGLFFTDILCAFIVAGIALILPLGARYVTQNVLGENAPDLLSHVYLMGAVMLALVVLHTLSNMFVDYRGHMMGALMESDMRAELFEHYQKLSFSFYDD
jgi:ATP-binding cassette subfamily B protein